MAIRSRSHLATVTKLRYPKRLRLCLIQYPSCHTLLALARLHASFPVSVSMCEPLIGALKGVPGPPFKVVFGGGEFEDKEEIEVTRVCRGLSSFAK